MAGEQPGFWDVEHRLRELSKHGDPLEKLAARVDFEIFWAELMAALKAHDLAKGGGPGFDLVLKFRMLVLQAMHRLSLEADGVSAARRVELDAVLRARPWRYGAGRKHAVGLS